MEVAQVLAMLNAGGVLAFAAVVWFELRAVRAQLEKMGEAMNAVATEMRVMQHDRDDLTPTHTAPRFPFNKRREGGPQR